MPKFLSLRHSEGQKTGPATRKTQRLSRLFKKAKNIFKRSNSVEPSPPSAPLNIPPLPEHFGDLLADIDGELSLIRDNTVADHSSSSLVSHPLEQGTSLVITGSTGRNFNEKTSAGPITSSSDVSVSSPHHETSALTQTRDLQGQSTASCSNSSTLVHHPLHTPDAIPDQTVQPSDDNSPRSSFDEPVGAPESSSVLDIVRHNWKNARDRLPSSAEIEQRTPQSHVQATEAGSSPSSWIDRGLDRSLRKDLLAVRAAFEEQHIPESIGFRSTDQDCTQIIPSHSTELSKDLASRHFFEGPVADVSATWNLPTLFCEPGNGAASEAGRSSTADSLSKPLSSSSKASKTLYFAQPLSEVERGRRTRLSFARRLEEALAEREANLTSKFVTEIARQRQEFEAAEQERYDSTASLHDIEFLNLQDDHEAETKELKQTAKDLRTRLADKAKDVRSLRREMDPLRDQSRESQTQLQEKCGQFDRLLQAFHEREAILQQRAEDFHDLREELDRTRRGCERSMRDSQCENSELERSYTELMERHDRLANQVEQSNRDQQRTEAQLKKSCDQLEAVKTALREQEQAHETLRARHDYVVSEKAKDYSWHVAHRQNPWAMKPMNTEDEIAEATEQLRGTLKQKTELSADLGRQLESAQASNKAKFKKLKRVIANQSQEKVILEMALTMAQGQRDHWAEQYDEMADAVASKLSFSSYARGVAERHILLQQRRYALESQLLEANLRGDRAVLECAIRQRHETIKLEKRDAEIAKLEHKLGIMKQKFEYENGMALLYKDVIDRETPRLRARNSEVERLLEDQITNNVNAHHRAVFDDLHRRVRKLEAIKQYWENEIDTFLQEHTSVKTNWGMFACAVFCDLTNAHGWRDERDRLELENVAFRERFANELINEPLVMSADKKTSRQIEDDFKLENINSFLLEQFAFTWGAVPKQLVSENAEPWEYLRVFLKEDFDERKKRLIAERDAIVAPFKEDCAEIPNDHEWIDDADEFEATWKGKGKVKMVGPGIGSDGQVVGSGSCNW